MGTLKFDSDKRVERKIDAYPDHAKERFKEIREMIIEIANSDDTIHSLEETLKWGEPSYLTPIGSTLRMDWKEKRPEEFAVFFKCTSLLVPTFREAFPNTFNFEANRAIWFRKEESLPHDELKSCITATLTYHKVKKQPNLGLM